MKAMIKQVRRTAVPAALWMFFATGPAGLALAAPAGVYERDTPFNGAIMAAADPAARDPADTHPGLNLIPWPKTIEVMPGVMELTAASRIVAADAGVVKPAGSHTAATEKWIEGMGRIVVVP